tara:strand:+ start:150 stop:350 length:201 start_codon:yes stop_codon:yes gene_type:complete
MKFRNSFLPITVISLIFGHLSISNAYAYLDPGTGSVVLQAIVGILVGAGITLKIYWQRIKMKFFKK